MLSIGLPRRRRSPLRDFLGDRVDRVEIGPAPSSPPTAHTPTSPGPSSPAQLANAEARARAAEMWLRINSASEELMAEGLRQIGQSRRLLRRCTFSPRSLTRAECSRSQAAGRAEAGRSRFGRQAFHLVSAQPLPPAASGFPASPTPPGRAGPGREPRTKSTNRTDERSRSPSGHLEGVALANPAGCDVRGRDGTPRSDTGPGRTPSVRAGCFHARTDRSTVRPRPRPRPQPRPGLWPGWRSWTRRPRCGRV